MKAITCYTLGVLSLGAAVGYVFGTFNTGSNYGSQQPITDPARDQLLQHVVERLEDNVHGDPTGNFDFPPHRFLTTEEREGYQEGLDMLFDAYSNLLPQSVLRNMESLHKKLGIPDTLFTPPVIEEGKKK